MGRLILPQSAFRLFIFSLYTPEIKKTVFTYDLFHLWHQNISCNTQNVFCCKPVECVIAMFDIRCYGFVALFQANLFSDRYEICSPHSTSSSSSYSMRAKGLKVAPSRIPKYQVQKRTRLIIRIKHWSYLQYRNLFI